MAENCAISAKGNSEKYSSISIWYRLTTTFTLAGLLILTSAPALTTDVAKETSSALVLS
jgi:hypothetical protein